MVRDFEVDLLKYEITVIGAVSLWLAGILSKFFRRKTEIGMWSFCLQQGRRDVLGIAYTHTWCSNFNHIIYVLCNS